jgi:long-chain acyl-CoA synthetase
MGRNTAFATARIAAAGPKPYLESQEKALNGAGMNQQAWPNLATMFFDAAARHGEQPFLWSKHDGVWRPQTWTSVANEVRQLSAGLTSLGVTQGDRVVLVSENRPNWVIADLAIMAAGGITVPAYTTNTQDLHHHVLSDSGAKVALVSTAALAGALLPAAERAGTPTLISMDRVESTEKVTVLHWDEAKARGAAAAAEVEARAAALGRDDVACFIYTSGTGGMPKGVMLSHHAILSNVRSIHLGFAPMLSGTETFLSFLPLSHSYEHTCGLYFPISIGAEIYYAEGADTLVANMPETRPTIMTCVPRLYEVMRQRIMAGVTRQGGKKEQLFNKALHLGTRKLEGQSLGPIGWVQDKVLEKLVRDKVRERFGGRLKALVSGGAPLNPEVGTFFQALGVTLLQGYGQTESAPVVSVNLPDRIKMATVGRPLPEVEVRIAEDGEILVRGGLLMSGYWNSPEATAEVLRDGWLHTGDIGHFDDDGFLAITDRKKDLIVNSGGDNIAPQRVEGILNLEPEIAQSMVVGDKRPYLVAVLVPDDSFVAEFRRAHKDAPATLEDLRRHKPFIAAMREVVDRANKNLGTIEKVKRFLVAQAPFDVENGQMTPTLKVRRHIVKAAYGDELEGLYRSST